LHGWNDHTAKRRDWNAHRQEPVAESGQARKERSQSLADAKAQDATDHDARADYHRDDTRGKPRTGYTDYPGPRSHDNTEHAGPDRHDASRPDTCPDSDVYVRERDRARG
jgi:hypothetical protein